MEDIQAKIASMHDIVENKDGHLMLVIYAYDGEPSSAELHIYKDQDRAFLRRAENDWIDLPDMHAEGAQKVRQAGSILVSEVSNDDVVRSYRVDVKNLAAQA